MPEKCTPRDVDFSNGVFGGRRRRPYGSLPRRPSNWLLEGEDGLGCGPQAVEIEEGAFLRGEDVHHHRTPVDDQPVLVRADAF